MQKKTDEAPPAQPQASTPQPAAPAAARSHRGWVPQRRFVVTMLVGLLGPLAAAALGAYLYLSGGRYVTTDNAFVKADKIAVSADIAGRVMAVMIVADQPVNRGDVMFRLDAEPLRLALERAEAELDQTRSQVEALRAEYLEAQSELNEAKDRLQFFDAQRARQKQLVDRGVGKAFVFEEADSNADAARARVNTARQRMQRVMAQLIGNPAIETAAHPLVRARLAQRDRARIELDRTEVRAPAAGIVTNFDLQPGEHVEAGRVVFSLVGTEELWIQANFKETDITHVETGQKATIHVDTYPDKDWTGIVASIAPATGAEFALLPPQNATGNWVKVVQRVPVRLRIEPRPGAKPLRAGMSVHVQIDTEHQRPLPRWAQPFLGWARASQ